MSENKRYYVSIENIFNLIKTVTIKETREDLNVLALIAAAESQDALSVDYDYFMSIVAREFSTDKVLISHMINYLKPLKITVDNIP